MSTAAKRKRKPKTVTQAEFADLASDLKTEDEWQRELINYFEGQSWLVTGMRRNVHLANGDHTTPLVGSPGYVDLTVAQRGRCAFLEVKGPHTPLEPHQVQWLNALAGKNMARTFWDADSVQGTPNYIVRGDGTGWDVLVAVVRPRHQLWVKATFAMEGIK